MLLLSVPVTRCVLCVYSSEFSRVLVGDSFLCWRQLGHDSCLLSTRSKETRSCHSLDGISWSGRRLLTTHHTTSTRLAFVRPSRSRSFICQLQARPTRHCIEISMGGASSLERLSGVRPTEKNLHRNVVPVRFSSREIRLMEKLLPSFTYREKSTEAHRHIAAEHWDKVFKESTKTGHTTHARDQQSSKVMKLYDVFFAYLEQHSPELKPVFRSSMHIRGKVLVHISVGMRSLMASETFADKVLALTKTHKRFGVKLEHYDPLGCALFHAMEVVSEHHWTPEVEDAWKRLFSHTSLILITAQQKTDTRTKKEAPENGPKFDLVGTTPEKPKRNAIMPALSDLFVLNRKASSRNSAFTVTTATSSRRD